MTGICLFTGFLAGIAFTVAILLIPLHFLPKEKTLTREKQPEPEPTPTTVEQERLKKQLDEINRFRG